MSIRERGRLRGGAWAGALVLAGGLAVAAVVAVTRTGTAERTPEGPGLGRPATAAEIAGWDVTIAPDGAGLPRGRGTAREGAAIYDRTCAACHGPEGMGRTAPELAGGVGSLASAYPDKTVGSYWPYATTLFDYVRSAMPPTAPRSLAPDEIYAVCAYLLFLSGIIGVDDEMNATTLPALRMPNRDGFVSVYKGPDM